MRNATCRVLHTGSYAAFSCPLLLSVELALPHVALSCLHFCMLPSFPSPSPPSPPCPCPPREAREALASRDRELASLSAGNSLLRVVKVVWADPAREVLLCGSFNGWTDRVRGGGDEDGG